jgi:GNAT superfamily N-acetyltransferase
LTAAARDAWGSSRRDEETPLFGRTKKHPRWGEPCHPARVRRPRPTPNGDEANFLWFRSRLARFVYVDRVVVAVGARGRGHARRLYLDLFERARLAGHDRVVCEVNSTPPNPGSDAFHAALGFTQIGAETIHGGAKTVRYLLRELGSA